MSTSPAQKDLILLAIKDYLERDGFLVKFWSKQLTITRPEVDRGYRYSLRINHSSLQGGCAWVCEHSACEKARFLLAQPDSLKLLAAKLKYCCLIPSDGSVPYDICTTCSKLHPGTTK